MADVTNIKDYSGTSVPIITDEVTDGTFGTGQVQYVKLMDGTVDGTGKIGGDATNGLDVDVTRVQGSVAITNNGLPTALGSSTSANSMRVVIATDQVAVAIKGSILDNAAFVDGTTPVEPVGYILDETAGTALTENDIGAARMDSKRAVVNVLEDATTRGQRAAVSSGGALKVDGSAATQPVSGTFWQATQPVSAASLPLPSGAAQDSTLTGGTQKSKLVDTGGTNVASVSAGGALKVDNSAVTQPVSGTFWQATQPVSIAAAVPVTDNSGSLTVDDGGGSITVDGTVSVTAPTSTTPTQTSVSGSASSVSLLASNSSRKGATFFNDSTSICYLKLGATASATSFSVQLTSNAYYEVPFGYTGAIDGIWAAATGSMRITELT